jgi:hypothetical protein
MEYIPGGSGGEFIYYLCAATGCDGSMEIDVSPVANLYFVFEDILLIGTILA